MWDIRIINWTFRKANGLIKVMGTTAMIKEEDGQLYIKLTGDVVDIIPIDDVQFQIKDVIAHFIGCDKD